MQQYYTFDQLVEQLPEICKEQRRFLQLTQADVVERLEKETGVRKDQSKISMFESGKIAFSSSFLSKGVFDGKEKCYKRSNHK